MGVYLVYVRFSVSCELANEPLEALWDELPECIELSRSGNTAHYLVVYHHIAASLEGLLSEPLSHSLVDDYAIIGIGGRCSAMLRKPDPVTEDGLDEYYDSDDLRSWLSYYSPADCGRPGFRRCGLLLFTRDERREDSKAISKLRRLLGESHTPHWHGRNSLFLTFWGHSSIEGLFDTGMIAQAVNDRAFSECLAFELRADYATRHGANSTLAGAFTRDPSSASRRGINNRPMKQHRDGCLRPAKRPRFVVERVKRRSRG